MHSFSVVDLQFMGASEEAVRQTPDSIAQTYRPILDRNHEKLLQVLDPDSFRHVGGRFFCDSEQLYIFCNKNEARNDFTRASTFYKAYKQVDFASFEVLTEHLAMDDKAIFLSSGHRIKKGKNFRLIRSPQVDVGPSLNKEAFLFPDDENDTPEVQKNLQAINRLASTLTAPAKVSIVFVDPQGKPMFEFDATGMSRREVVYFAQDDDVYYLHHKLSDVNAAKFRHLGGAYFTDGKSVYCEADKLHCDTPSFLAIDGDPYRGTDRYRCFYRASGSALRPGSSFESRGVVAFFNEHPELHDYWYFQKFFSSKIYANAEGLYYQGYPVATKEGLIPVQEAFSFKSLSQCFTKHEYGFCSIDDRLYYKLDNYIYFQALPEGDVASFRELGESSYEDRHFCYSIEYGKLKIKKKKKSK